MVASSSAGCGNGGDAKRTDELAARATFSAEVNAICERYSRRFEQVPKLGSVADVGRWSREIRGVVIDGLAEQKTVDPPRAYAADYRRWLEYGDEQVAVLTKLEAASKREDIEAYDRLFPAADRADDKADVIARRLGLTSCDGG